MGKFFEQISPEQRKLIVESKLFFIASSSADRAMPEEGAGPINLSPKGATPLHIIDDNTVAYLDYPGSGNETAKHVSEGSLVTIMVMSFGHEDAAIVRLYGAGTIYSLENCPYADEILAVPSEHLPRPRQIVELKIARTQTSCGYGVPVYDYVRERSKDARGKAFK